MHLQTQTTLLVGGQPVAPPQMASIDAVAPPLSGQPLSVAVDVTLPANPAGLRPSAGGRPRANSLPAAAPMRPSPTPPPTVRCVFTVTAPPPAPEASAPTLASAPGWAISGAASERLDAEGPPLRNQLGFISRRIKPALGNVARRGMMYGVVTGIVAATLLSVAAPIVGPFCAIAGTALAAAVPVALLVCVLGGAIAEVVARRRRLRDVSVQDVRALEKIYTLLQDRRRTEGKLSFEDREAWHKVNRMLEEMSGGFWRGVRLILATQFGMRMHCGRYRVGDVFAETREPEAQASAKVG